MARGRLKVRRPRAINAAALVFIPALLVMFAIDFFAPHRASPEGEFTEGVKMKGGSWRYFTKPVDTARNIAMVAAPLALLFGLLAQWPFEIDRSQPPPAR